MNHNSGESGHYYPSRMCDSTPQPTSLRKSCDHCHANKLKCSPGTSFHSACLRCQKAGHPCNYSARSTRRSTHKARLLDSPNSPKSPRVASTSEQDWPSVTPLGPYVTQDSGPSVADWPWWWGENENSQFEDSGSNAIPIDFNPNSLLQAVETDLDTYSLPVGRELEDPVLCSESRPSLDRNARGHHEQSNNLLSASQALEVMLHCVAVEWPGKDIQHYPIGELFSAFERLKSNLEPLPKGATVMDEWLRTKNTFLAAYAYITCVKIMSSLAKTLRRHVKEAQQQSSNTTPAACSHPAASSQLEEKTGLHSNLKIDDLFSRINPYVHALASCCATLRIGLQHLRQIEVALSIPRERGVASSSRLSSIFVEPSEPSESSGVGLLSAAYLLKAFWNNEMDAAEDTGASTTMLDELLQCCREMFDLGSEHKF